MATRRGRRYTREQEPELRADLHTHCVAEYRRFVGSTWPDREVLDVVGHPLSAHYREIELEQTDKALLGVSKNILRRESLIEAEARGNGLVLRPKAGKENKLIAFAQRRARGAPSPAEVDAARARQIRRARDGSLRLSGAPLLVRLFRDDWLPFSDSDLPPHGGALPSVDMRLAIVSVLAFGLGDITNWHGAYRDSLTVAEVLEREANAIRMERGRQEGRAARLRAKRRKPATT